MTLEELQAQVEALSAQLAQQNGGRTPEVRKPLTNLLYPPPSATVAKPNFFYEGMNLPNVAGTPFPALRFRLTPTGVEERCVKNVVELAALGEEWSASPPSMELPSPLESVQDVLDGLTPEERTLVMDEQRKVRLAAIQQMLANLSPEELAAVSTGSPVKRGPGRPKKV